MSANLSTMGERIRMFRKDAGLTQADLARELGLGRAAVNKYENGTIENIPLTTIEHMAEIFNVSPAEIVGWDTPDANLSTKERAKLYINHVYGSQVLFIVDMLSQMNQKGLNRVQVFCQDMKELYSKSGE